MHNVYFCAFMKLSEPFWYDKGHYNGKPASHFVLNLFLNFADERFCSVK